MPYRHRVTVGGTVFRVDVEIGNGGALQVRVDDEPSVLEVRIGAGGDLVWFDGTRVIAARAERLSGPAAVFRVVSGNGAAMGPWDTTVEDARSVAVAGFARRSDTALGAATVIAPMPGKVIKFLVKEGDRLAAGQGVVVVEAMKMENELQAPCAGTVSKIHVQEGRAIEAGTVILAIA